MKKEIKALALSSSKSANNYKRPSKECPILALALHRAISLTICMYSRLVCVYDFVVYFTPPLSNKDTDHLSFLEKNLIVQDDFLGYYFSRSVSKQNRLAREGLWWDGRTFIETKPCTHKKQRDLLSPSNILFCGSFPFLRADMTPRNDASAARLDRQDNGGLALDRVYNRKNSFFFCFSLTGSHPASALPSHRIPWGLDPRKPI